MRMLASMLFALCAVGHAQEAQYSGHGADSVAKEVVAKFAPPPLDPRFTREIELMLDVAAPGLGIPSPDGKALFFGWRITGSAQVYKLARPMGFPDQLTGGQENTALNGVTPDGKWIV